MSPTSADYPIGSIVIWSQFPDKRYKVIEPLEDDPEIDSVWIQGVLPDGTLDPEDWPGWIEADDPDGEGVLTIVSEDPYATGEAW